MEGTIGTIGTTGTTETIETLTSFERWMIRSSWSRLEPLVDAKGFGSFQSLKEKLGMPTGSRDDHRDWSNAPESGEVQKKEETIEIGSRAQQQKGQWLTVVFYKHLFETNPHMKEIFWRFNLHQSMEKIVQILNSEDLQGSLKALAERHRGRGILNIDYDRIGESLLFALDQVSESQLTKSAAKAWIKAWNIFGNAMKVPDLVHRQQEQLLLQQQQQQQQQTDGKSEPPLAIAAAVAVQSSSLSLSPSSSTTTTTTTTTDTKIGRYSMEQVRQHNTKSDIWIVIDSKVYDVTLFVPVHPGKEMILLGAGRDATKLFADFHSSRAKMLLQRYFIGDLIATVL